MTTEARESAKPASQRRRSAPRRGVDRIAQPLDDHVDRGLVDDEGRHQLRFNERDVAYPEPFQEL